MIIHVLVQLPAYAVDPSSAHRFLFLPFDTWNFLDDGFHECLPRPPCGRALSAQGSVARRNRRSSSDMRPNLKTGSDVTEDRPSETRSSLTQTHPRAAAARSAVSCANKRCSANRNPCRGRSLSRVPVDESTESESP